MNSGFSNTGNPFRKGMSTYHDPCHNILSQVQSAQHLAASCSEFDSASLLLTALDGFISAGPFDSLYSFDSQKIYVSEFNGSVMFCW